MSIPIWCAAFCLYVTSFVQYMILKCAAKKCACAAHAAKNEGQAHMKQPSIFSGGAPNAVGSSGRIPYFRETLLLKNFDHENANK